MRLGAFAGRRRGSFGVRVAIVGVSGLIALSLTSPFASTISIHSDEGLSAPQVTAGRLVVPPVGGQSPSPMVAPSTPTAEPATAAPVAVTPTTQAPNPVASTGPSPTPAPQGLVKVVAVGV